ncbi:amino acid decarboxylase [Bacillus sp. FJAT-27231]|uniref:pyridoxal phosphate-dependent decarboxylase family protein n=1 Tax=Bacillus sp. FJAT-27231 TaxID=1679168 RepID=UPI000670B2E8|nr:pyridoxal-dependent decarboxylase [Bacillus sp. FJAT-27231]KMY52640.1 amino acid decarboxylase [Bacillus sp. FJAT-27231]
MNIMNQDQKDFERILTEVVQHATNFYHGLEERCVAVQSYDMPKNQLSTSGIGASAALEYFTHHYATGLSASVGSRYLGFVTGGSTPAAIIGDWLVSIYDQNAASSQDSIAGLVELETIDLLKELLHLSHDYSGTFVSGATMANFVGLAQARQWIAHHYGKDISMEGLYDIPSIKILSGAPHSSVFKAASMLGIGRKSIHSIPCQENREAIDIEKLKEFLEQQKSEPCIVVANVGTVNTVDYDDLAAIGKLKKHYRFWLHIDAAFGGFAACSPLYRELVEGMDAADSITIDAHKWLNVPYDSAMQFTRHKQLQAEVFQNNAAYLGDAIEHPEFFNLTPENSRRFRALPAWFTLKAYGKSGYQNLIEQNVELAKRLGEKINNSREFKLLSPVRLNVVCFSLNKQSITAEMNNQFLTALNQQGKVFMTPTIYNGVPAIRAAFSNWRTEEKDIDIIWEALRSTVQSIK